MKVYQVVQGNLVKIVKLVITVVDDNSKIVEIWSNEKVAVANVVKVCV